MSDSKISEGAKSSKRAVIYATIPKLLLSHPPIRHRHTSYSQRHLSVFEFAIAAALVASARASLTDEHHARAFATGRDRINLEKQLSREFKEDWDEVKKHREHGIHRPAPTRVHVSDLSRIRHKPMALGKSLKAAGAKGYKDGHKQSRNEPPPKVITIELTRSALLRLAGLATDGQNLRRIGPALSRLRLVAAKGPGPVLIACQEKESGKLSLGVSGQWLAPPFSKIPIPLPRSANAMALYLFLHWVDTSRTNTTVIGLKALCERLGIPTKGGGADMMRSIKRALATVNAHLKELDIAALAKLKPPIKVPSKYHLIIGDAGEIRFQHQRRAINERHVDEMHKDRERSKKDSPKLRDIPISKLENVTGKQVVNDTPAISVTKIEDVPVKNTRPPMSDSERKRLLRVMAGWRREPVNESDSGGYYRET